MWHNCKWWKHILEVKLRCTRLLLKHSLVLPRSSEHNSEPAPPCHHHSGCRTAQQAAIDWVTSSPAFMKLAGEEIKSDHESSEVLLGFAFGKYAVGFCWAWSFSTSHLSSFPAYFSWPLIAHIRSLNLYSATSSENIKLLIKILNFQGTEAKPEKQKYWPNYL